MLDLESAAQSSGSPAPAPAVVSVGGGRGEGAAGRQRAKFGPAAQTLEQASARVIQRHARSCLPQSVPTR